MYCLSFCDSYILRPRHSRKDVVQTWCMKQILAIPECYAFRVKTLFGSPFSHLFSGKFMLLILFAFIWIYWCLHIRWCSCPLTVTRRLSHVEQELLTLSEHMSSSSIFSGVRVAQSLVFCVVFCRSLFCSFVIFLLAIVLSVLLRFTASVYPFGIFKLFLSFCPFSFGHCVVCPSSIYCFCLPLWYHQILLVLLSFFFWPLRCLSFFDLWILITPLVSSNSSCTFVIFLFAITLSVLRFTASAYRFGIFKVSLFPYDYVIHVYSCDKEHVLRTSRLYKFIYEQ